MFRSRFVSKRFVKGFFPSVSSNSFGTLPKFLSHALRSLRTATLAPELVREVHFAALGAFPLLLDHGIGLSHGSSDTDWSCCSNIVTSNVCVGHQRLPDGGGLTPWSRALAHDAQVSIGSGERSLQRQLEQQRASK